MFSYLDNEMQSDQYFLVMEYCTGGDLRKQISLKKRNNHKFNVLQVVNWSLQIAAALEFCHERLVIHRDVKVNTKLSF